MSSSNEQNLTGFYSRLPIERGQLWVSMGKDSRCIGQLALIVSLQSNYIIITQGDTYLVMKATAVYKSAHGMFETRGVSYAIC
jgi:hypothetical protein